MKALANLGFNFSDYLLILLLTICVITDIKSRRVYNKVLVPFLAVSLAAAFITGGWNLLLESVKGIILGLVILIIPFIKGGLGAGDVKLLAVIGAIKGPVFVLYAFLTGALAGGLLALVFLAVNRQLMSTMTGLLQTFLSLASRYGTAIPAGHRKNETRKVYFPYTLAISAGVITIYAAGLNTW